MDINIFLLCYNERVLLPHTIHHYKTHLPSCTITIYDNESTDDSVEIAKSLGCKIISWNSSNMIDDHKYANIKNNCWKSLEKGWVIMADMDEWLCVTEHELQEEMLRGTTILSVTGIEMIGQSDTLDLSDIDLNQITAYQPNTWLNKRLCFLRDDISEMQYNLGAHACKPIGRIQSSHVNYKIKHMSMLGLPYIIDKMVKRYERSEVMRSMRLATHYINDIDKIREHYMEQLRTASHLS